MIGKLVMVNSILTQVSEGQNTKSRNRSAVIGAQRVRISIITIQGVYSPKMD